MIFPLRVTFPFVSQKKFPLAKEAEPSALINHEYPRNPLVPIVILPEVDVYCPTLLFLVPNQIADLSNCHPAIKFLEPAENTFRYFYILSNHNRHC